MKRQGREAYRCLTTLPLPIFEGATLCLCTFCGHASWSGSCNEAELECEHPLDAVSESDMDVWEGFGRDCWGFRPQWSREDCVDITGIFSPGQVA